MDNGDRTLAAPKGVRGAPALAEWARLAAAGGLLARHFLALAATVVVLTVLWTAIYILLLLWALLGGEGLGSPLAYPLGLLILLGGAVAAGLCLFLPATALAEWVARRRGCRVLAQIPLATIFFLIFCLFGGGLWALAAGASFTAGAAAVRGLNLFVLLLLPFGLYWWVAQGWSVAYAGLGVLLRGGKQTLRRAGAAGKRLGARARRAARRRHSKV